MFCLYSQRVCALFLCFYQLKTSFLSKLIGWFLSLFLLLLQFFLQSWPALRHTEKGIRGLLRHFSSISQHFPVRQVLSPSITKALKMKMEMNKNTWIVDLIFEKKQTNHSISYNLSRSWGQTKSVTTHFSFWVWCLS